MPSKVPRQAYHQQLFLNGVLFLLVTYFLILAILPPIMQVLFRNQKQHAQVCSVQLKDINSKASSVKRYFQSDSVSEQIACLLPQKSSPVQISARVAYPYLLKSCDLGSLVHIINLLAHGADPGIDYGAGTAFDHAVKYADYPIPGSISKEADQFWKQEVRRRRKLSIEMLQILRAHQRRTGLFI